MIFLTVIIGILAVAAVSIVLIVKSLTEICQPNEILVFSGGVDKGSTGNRPYRLIHGGRAMRVPLGKSRPIRPD